MSRTARTINLDAFERELLLKIDNKRSVPEFLKRRLQVVLAAANGKQNKDIAHEEGLEVHFIGRWRKRWATHHQRWKQTDELLRPEMNERLVLLWLNDEKGRGRKNHFTAEQRTKIAALSQELPEQHGLPLTHWTPQCLADIAVKREIVDTISASTVTRILKKTTCRPTGVAIGSMQK